MSPELKVEHNIIAEMSCKFFVCVFFGMAIDIFISLSDGI